MEKLPFYLCSGFHRSGTSLVSLSMIDNGIDMGTSLMGPSFSNALGHGEDLAFVELHDQILHLNGEDWRYHKRQLPQLMNDSVAKMEQYIEKRKESLNCEAIAFGAKDPRALFFLDAWYTACQQNIKFMLVFRDWKFAVSSLLKRHSRTLLQFNQSISHRSEDINFWLYPDLAAQMWLVSAERMLDCADSYSADTLLFEQSAMIEKNEQLCQAAVLKGILPNALQCDVFQPDLMQQNIPSSMLNMISPSLQQQCDNMLVKLRKAADVACAYKAETRPAPQLVNDLITEFIVSGAQEKVNRTELQLPSVENSKISFRGQPIEDRIVILKTMHKDSLKQVDWDEILAYPDIPANNLIELFYLSVKANIDYASEIFILRAIRKRNLHWQWVHLGDHYFRLKHFASAAECYAKANEIKPEHPGIMAKLADIATVEKRYDDTVVLLQKARALDPENKAIQDAQIRLDRASRISNQDSVIQDEDNHTTKLITDYRTVLNAMAHNADFGKKLDHFMVETNFWLRDNSKWLQDGIEPLTESAQRCLLDYLLTHLAKYWSTESLYAAFIKSEHLLWQRYLSKLHHHSVLGDYLINDTKLGVHIHAYYLHLIPEIFAFLKALPSNTQIVITGPSSVVEKLATIQILPDTCSIIPTENKGRDIAPWLLVAAPKLKECDIVLKLHTKATPHASELAGWRAQLLWSVIGNRKNIVSISERFKQNSSLGLLLPQYHPKIAPKINWGENYPFASDVAVNLGLSGLPLDVDPFPAGSMFWYRPKALLKLTTYPWGLNDFPEEDGQIDCTVMHAIERLISTTAMCSGFKIGFIDRYPKDD